MIGILKLYGILSAVVILVTYIYHLLGQSIGKKKTMKLIFLA
jgi:hypothetical protein